MGARATKADHTAFGRALPAHDVRALSLEALPPLQTARDGAAALDIVDLVPDAAGNLLGAHPGPDLSGVLELHAAHLLSLAGLHGLGALGGGLLGQGGCRRERKRCNAKRQGKQKAAADSRSSHRSVLR